MSEEHGWAALSEKTREWLYVLAILTAAYLAIGVAYSTSSDTTMKLGGHLLWSVIKITCWPVLWAMGN
jgi:hypothetical protein